MSLVSPRPDTGARLSLRLEADHRYVGEVATAAGAIPVLVTVLADDAVALEPGAGAVLDEAMAERIRLLVRTAVRHARADGRPLPTSLRRWRP